MTKNRRFALAAVGLLLLAMTAMMAVFLFWWKAPPAAARLLPESDAVVYVDLKPLRAATHFDRSIVARSVSYQQFINGTGIVLERDLDAGAFALHRMADASGPNGPVGYSEAFSGRFDAERLSHYLAQQAAGTEAYAGHAIFAIPSEGRTLRVAVLGHGTVLASNMPTAEQIHLMLNRAARNSGAESSLLSARYGDVPAFSSAWAVGAIGLPFADDGQISALGLKLPLPADTPLVASIRYQGSLRLRVEEIASSDAEAERSAEALAQLLGLFRALHMAHNPVAHTDEERAVRALVDSVKVGQRQDRTWLTATVPPEALRRIFGL